MGVDRSALARSVFGAGAMAPPGPMSRLLWIWSDCIRDPAVRYGRGEEGPRRRRMAAAGRRRVRRRGNHRLAFDILVPSTSGSRRQLAVQLQEAWRTLGAEVTVTAVDFAGVPGAAGAGSVRQLHRRVAGRAHAPRAGGSVEQVGVGGDQLRPIRQSGFDSLLAGAGREPGVGKPRRSTARRWTRSTPTPRRSSSTHPPIRRRRGADREHRDRSVQLGEWIAQLEGERALGPSATGQAGRGCSYSHDGALVSRSVEVSIVERPEALPDLALDQ